MRAVLRGGHDCCCQRPVLDYEIAERIMLPAPTTIATQANQPAPVRNHASSVEFFPMLLAYIDESYNRRRYRIAAMMCTDECVVNLTEALDEVVTWASSSYVIDPDAELHGHALFHGQEDWAPMAGMPRARISVHHKALAAIATSAPEICIRGIDIPALNRRYGPPDHPHSVVLQHVLENIDKRAEPLNLDPPCR